MKKISSILASLTLSVLLIALSVGVGIVYCNHSETTNLAITSTQKMCNKGNMDEGCCSKEHHKAIHQADCMSFKVLQIDVTNISPSHTFCFYNTSFVVPYILNHWNEWTLSHLYQTINIGKWGGNFRSPPRDYLRKLRILRL